MGLSKKPLPLLITLGIAFSLPFLIFSAILGVASCFGKKTVNIDGTYYFGLKGLMYAFGIGIYGITSAAFWVQSFINAYVLKREMT